MTSLTTKAEDLTASLPRVLTYLSYFAVFAICLFAAVPSQAQDEFAPPPSQAVSRDDLQRLSAAPGRKERTKLAIEIINTHLTAAEQFRENENFESAYRELGLVHGLVDRAIGYLRDEDRRDNKVLDDFKRLEIGLRGFLPRIESIRREMPLRYDEYLRALLKHVRDARSKATEPFFDDSIYKEPESTHL